MREREVKQEEDFTNQGSLLVPLITFFFHLLRSGFCLLQMVPIQNISIKMHEFAKSH